LEIDGLKARLIAGLFVFSLSRFSNRFTWLFE